MMAKSHSKNSKNTKPAKMMQKSAVRKRKNSKSKSKLDKNLKKQDGLKHKTSDRSIIDLENSSIQSKPSKSELKSVLEGLKSNSSLVLVKKALKYLPHYMKSEGLTKKLLKELIRLWSEAGEKVRVVCLLCLIRIHTKLKSNDLKQLVLKKLYTEFLEKCRITKRETMSMIGFMRHSLIELYKLDPENAFKQAQTSCQQLTVTLKNAKTHKNEDTYKTVLNWQFANCLILLSQLIIAHKDNSQIKSLTQDVIKLNLGAIDLLTSPRYYPFYCHLIDNLIRLSESSGLFIPILPFIVGIVNKIELPRLEKSSANSNKSESKKKTKDDVNKRLYKKLKGGDDDSEMDIGDEESQFDTDLEDKPDDDSDNDNDNNDNDGDNPKKREYNMDLLNHVSLKEAHCLEYQLAVLDKAYELLLKYLAGQCHRIAFSELMLLPGLVMKKWLRKQPIKRVEKFQVLLDKIKADCRTSEEARKSIDFAFTNYAAVDAWEKRLRDSKRLQLPKMLAALEAPPTE